jgi:Outer membrane protein beta-barrel domain
MKRITLGLLVLLGLTLSEAVHGQAQLAVGIKGGLNFAKLDVSSSVASNYENRTGYHAGAFALIKLTKIGIQPEIIFSRQGSQYQFNSQDLEANFDYINIPIILKLYTVAGINLQAGPQFGFLSKAEAETVINGVKSMSDVKDLYKDSDLSLALGVGWDLPFGLTLDARYNFGISDISDGPNNNETKNQVWQISAGFKILKLGK